MISQLSGILIHKALPWVVLETNSGVAYEVQVPMSTAYELPEIGQKAQLFTHLVVREDAHELCGFSSRSERDLFRILLKANGIGPKSALGILSGIDAQTFVRSVLSEDWSLLTSIPGIGKKTAERLVIDLKDKIQKWEASGALEGAESSLKLVQPGAVSDAMQEAVSALQALGYREGEIRAVLKKQNLLDENHTAEHIIRQVLKAMVVN
jgi:Holliday junction DNA helicase RuvA